MLGLIIVFGTLYITAVFVELRLVIMVGGGGGGCSTAGDCSIDLSVVAAMLVLLSVPE